MSLPANYPTEQGWIRILFTMKDATPLPESSIRHLAACGEPEHYDFGPITQTGRKVTILLRHKSRAPRAVL